MSDGESREGNQRSQLEFLGRTNDPEGLHPLTEGRGPRLWGKDRGLNLLECEVCTGQESRDSTVGSESMSCRFERCKVGPGKEVASP